MSDEAFDGIIDGFLPDAQELEDERNERNLRRENEKLRMLLKDLHGVLTYMAPVVYENSGLWVDVEQALRLK